MFSLIGRYNVVLHVGDRIFFFHVGVVYNGLCISPDLIFDFNASRKIGGLRIII